MFISGPDTWQASTKRGIISGKNGQGGTMSLKDYVLRIRKQWKLILISTVVFCVSGVIFALQPQEAPIQMYSASSKVLFVVSEPNQNKGESNKFPTVTASDLLATESVHEAIADSLGISARAFDEKVSLTSSSTPGSDLLFITATSAQPDLPVNAANEAARLLELSAPELLGVQSKVVETAIDSVPTVDLSRNTPVSEVVIPTVLGLMLGLFIAFLRSWLNNTLASSRELQDISKSNIFTVRASGANSGNKTIWSADDLHKVRSSLFARNIQKPAIVLVVNESSQTVFSQFFDSLVDSIQTTGNKTLVIDCDLAHQSSFGFLENSVNFIGISNDTIQSTHFQKLIFSCTENLDVLASAGDISRQDEVFASKEFSNFLTKVSGKYDVVLIASPSYEMQPTSLTLLPWVHDVVIVTEVGVTRLPAISQSARVLEENSDKYPSIVVINSKVDAKKSQVRP